MMLAAGYDAFLFDLDGVLYRGHAPVPHAADSVARLRSMRKGVAFVTNNSSRTPGAVADTLVAVGVPALPADVQTGERFTAFHAELAASSVPLVLYGEWLRAWNREEARPEPVRVAGAELRLERLVPAEFDRTLTFRLGIARIFSDAPRFRATRAYAALVYRP
jgi:ribonucleotide monophosphatase NagD (HAD superfamily)